MMMSILLMNGMSTVSADLVKPSSLVRKVSPVSNDMTRHDKEQGRRLVADSLFQENEKGAADPVILMSDEAHGREAAELTGSEPFEHKIVSLRLRETNKKRFGRRGTHFNYPCLYHHHFY
jgi:hypothetical protein